MFPSSQKHREMTTLRRGIPAFSLLLPFWRSRAAPPRVHAQIDYGIDQTVWMMLYGVTQAQVGSASWLAEDSDGDGISNEYEMLAGTNPFDAKSTFAVTSVTQAQSSNGVAITFPTQPGKLYSLQSTPNLGVASSWTALSPAVQVEGTGGPMMLAAPSAGNASHFYRVVVGDVDSIGDGVSDWAGTIYRILSARYQRDCQ